MPENITIADSVIYQTMNDEIVVLNMDSQQYFGLDPIGAEIWKLLMEHRTPASVANHICELYQVDEETALRDVRQLISQLVAAGLAQESVTS